MILLQDISEDGDGETLAYYDLPTQVRGEILPIALVRVTATRYEVRAGPVVVFREEVCVTASAKFVRFCAILREALAE